MKVIEEILRRQIWIKKFACVINWRNLISNYANLKSSYARSIFKSWILACVTWFQVCVIWNQVTPVNYAGEFFIQICLRNSMINGEGRYIYRWEDLVLTSVKKGKLECKGYSKNKMSKIITIISWIHIFIYFQFQY